MPRLLTILIFKLLFYNDILYCMHFRCTVMEVWVQRIGYTDLQYLTWVSLMQRQHLSAVSAISHNFLFSAQIRIILHSPHNSAYFCPSRTFSHILLKMALDCTKTTHILSECGTFSSLLIGIWDVFVLADRNLGRFRPS